MGVGSVRLDRLRVVRHALGRQPPEQATSAPGQRGEGHQPPEQETSAPGHRGDGRTRKETEAAPGQRGDGRTRKGADTAPGAVLGGIDFTTAPIINQNVTSLLKGTWTLVPGKGLVLTALNWWPTVFPQNVILIKNIQSTAGIYTVEYLVDNS